MKKTKPKLRKSIRMLYILLSVAAIIICSTLIYGEVAEKSSIIKKEVLKYQNKFKADYKVNVKENSFIEAETLPMGKVYVTELIDSIDMNLKYLYEATEDANIKYNYSIVGVLEAQYSIEGVNHTVWEKEYELKPITENSITGKNIEINESINIDLEKYNDEISKFEQKFGMGVRATLGIELRVAIGSEIEKTQVFNDYSTNIELDLGEKTTQIRGDLNQTENETVKQEQTVSGSVNKIIIFVYVGIIILAVIVLKKVLLDTRNSNIVRNTYRLELNKILKSCGDKIVKLSQKLDLAKKEIIEVKDFGELIKLSEELYKPILYWNSMGKEDAEFFIITNNVIYRYKLQ